MPKVSATERTADLMADNIVLRGIVAYLLSKAEPDIDARTTALKTILAAIKPEIEDYVAFYRQMSQVAGEAELQRIQRRGSRIVELAGQLSERPTIR